MTISTATLPDESLLTGAPSSPSSRPGLVIFREFDAGKPLPLPNTVSLDQLLGSYSEDAELQAAMADARREMAGTLYANESATVSSLRLAAGLSQAQVAARMGTSQSHVARLESGTSDPGTDVVARLAAALEVDEATAFSAVRYQRISRAAAHDS